MGADDPRDPERIEAVLASIRALVSAETNDRLAAGAEPVLLLTPEMRVSSDDLDDDGEDDDAPEDAGEILTSGLGEPKRMSAPVPLLDEEAVRALVQRIIREELRGALGDRISRNLRTLIRRELARDDGQAGLIDAPRPPEGGTSDS